MADDILNIRAGTYRACIALNQLPGLTLAKYRKLLQLMLDYRSDNQEALKWLGVWLAKYERRTKTALDDAQADANGGIDRTVNPRSRTKMALPILAQNRRLRAAVADAAAIHYKAAKLLEIYQSIL